MILGLFLDCLTIDINHYYYYLKFHLIDLMINKYYFCFDY
jgi:hypothetical protein